MLPSDAELLKTAATGDQGSFAILYDRHSPTVFGLLRTMLREPREAEDVLQDAFLQAWRQAHKYDSNRSTVLGWLVMMARSRALDRLRRRPVLPTSEVPDQPVLPMAETRAELDESAAAVRHALGQLPTEQKAAIELAFYGGLTYEQVAARQEVPVGTAKTRIRLGMIKMRKLLEPTEGVV